MVIDMHIRYRPATIGALMLTLTVSACLSRRIATTTAPALPTLPRAAVRVERTTLNAITLVDPYRWMEDTSTNEFQAWAAGQNTYTRALLERSSLRLELLTRLQTLTASRDEIKSVQVRPSKFFYLKRPATEDRFSLYIRGRNKQDERLLVDPVTLGPGSSIDYYEPSPSGRYIAFGVSSNGSEASVLRVVAVDTGALLPDVIDRARHGEPRWRPDETSFFYRRSAATPPGSPVTAKYQGSRNYLHVLGENPDKDSVVFGYDVTSRVQLEASDSPYVFLWPNCHYAFGLVQHGTSNEISVYIAPLSSIDGPRTPWQRIADVEDKILDITARGREAFLLTHRDAPRGKVVRIDLERPELAHSQTIIAPSNIVLSELTIASDALYVRMLEDGIGRIARVDFATKSSRLLALPVSGSITDFSASPTTSGITVPLQSWTQAKIYYSYDPENDTFKDNGIQAQQQLPALESREVKVRSKDGTLVPLSIIYPRNLDRGSPHPTLLSGYGSYGISITSGFDPRRLAWLERGGIYAVAHVRGGGEYGEEWHVAGMKQNKQNTIDDFIACAEFLIREGYTTSDYLAAEGVSAGGITVGSAITQAPGLFAAALLRVSITDALRFENTPLGPQNSKEFGTAKNPTEIKPMHDMSPYYHVVDGVRYPAVMFTASAHDARVPMWQPAKMAARLQAATASDRPILFRLETGAGHGYGFGTTNTQLNQELADCYAFLLWQLGPASTRSGR